MVILGDGLALEAGGKPHSIVSTSERALSALFNATGGPQWKNKQGWFFGFPCEGAWYGIECHSRYIDCVSGM